jgi:hypothetical protein
MSTEKIDIEMTSALFDKAAKDLEDAKKLVLHDKNQRTGLLSQLVDFAIDTPAEKRVIAAQTNFDNLSISLKATALEWVDSQVVKLINVNPSDSQTWGSLLHERIELEAKYNPIKNLLDLGTNAFTSLKNAIAHLKEASWHEGVDAIFNNKMNSLISLDVTEGTQLALNAATVHTRAFQNALNGNATPNFNVLSGEKNDFLFDMAGVTNIIDFSSFQNIDNLHNTHIEIVNIHNSLLDPFHAIESAHNILKPELDALNKQMLQIEQRHRTTVEMSMPLSLRKLIDHEQPLVQHTFESTTIPTNSSAIDNLLKRNKPSVNHEGPSF